MACIKSWHLNAAAAVFVMPLVFLQTLLGDYSLAAINTALFAINVAFAISGRRSAIAADCEAAQRESREARRLLLDRKSEVEREARGLM